MEKYSEASNRRCEYKYLIGREPVSEVTGFLSQHLKLDEYSRERENNSYTVRSIYYDSPSFTCFHEKLDGQKYREKFRVRTYNEPGTAPIFLEDKKKNGLFYEKPRAELSDDTIRIIDDPNFDSNEEMAIPEEDRTLIDRFLFHLRGKGYFPVALVAYDREAYIEPGGNNIRVTLDKNLRAGLFPSLDQIHEEERLEYILYNWIILEVKFSQLVPRWLKRLVSLFNLNRQACSKYCTSIGHFLGEAPELKESVANV
ncbi:polyphosphate polymerase domain-containing protein [Candidatus Bipolaricaulota bacterium]|nr:polyphosphate polymerase domain-containing protein [Candidatus Bipolaricaulota bacterium]